MFDFGVGYSELVVLAIVAVIVIGPKDLPRVLRTLGQFMNKARGMAREFQGHVDAAMKDAGVSDLKKDVDALKTTISSSTSGINLASPVIAPSTPSSTYGISSAAKEFETYFGNTGATGETRVAGNRVMDTQA